MRREDIGDIIAFLAVARERSFTRAAAKIGVSQSALSHTVRGLEERLGLRLLTRTTRSVAPTQAGERLLRSAGPHLEAIDAELAGLTACATSPAGRSALRRASTQPTASYGRRCGGCFRTIPISRSRSSSTTVSPISWRSATTRESGLASRSPRT